MDHLLLRRSTYVQTRIFVISVSSWLPPGTSPRVIVSPSGSFGVSNPTLDFLLVAYRTNFAFSLPSQQSFEPRKQLDRCARSYFLERSRIVGVEVDQVSRIPGCGLYTYSLGTQESVIERHALSGMTSLTREVGPK